MGNKDSAGNRVALTDSPARPKKRRKKAKGRIIVMVLMVLLLVASVLFMVLMGRYVYKQIFSGNGEAPESVDLSPYEHTAQRDQDKVSYYVLGVLGKEDTSAMASMTLICHDKRDNQLRMMQIPPSTYIDNEAIWGTVHTAGLTFGQPRDYDWCDLCKQRLSENQIQNGKHLTCGTAVSKRTGSAVLSLMSVFNDQLGMPVDHYFLVPQQALVKLINLMDDVMITLDSEIKVGELTYSKGDQIVDGEAALYYMTHADKPGVQGEIQLLERQRSVMASVLERVLSLDAAAYNEDTLRPLQRGSTPIRTDLPPDDLIAFVLQMQSLKTDRMLVYTMPGAIVTKSAMQYYSADREGLLQLFNQSFNPVTKMTLSDLRIPELSDISTEPAEYKLLSEYLPREAK